MLETEAPRLDGWNDLLPDIPSPAVHRSISGGIQGVSTQDEGIHLACFFF
jgi:hypothetical protein